MSERRGFDLSPYGSLGDALRDAVKKHRDHVALIEADRDRENGRWTYAQFQKESERVASLLQEHGLQAGDRCAILMSNQSKWLFSATGAFWSGAVVVPLDYKLTPEEQLALIRHSKPEVLIVEWPIWMRIDPNDPVFDRTKVFVTEAPKNASKDASLGKPLGWETPAAGPFTYKSRTRGDIACIVYSSGTGGRAKGCMLTHGNYLAQAQVLGEMFPIAPEDRYFSILPTNHAIDFMCGFFLPLQFGAAVVHQRTLRPEFLAATMKKYGVSHMAIVPMLLKALEKRIREKLAELPGWKRAMIAALKTLNAAMTKRKPCYPLSSKLLKPVHASFGGKLKLLFAGGAFVDAGSAQFFYDLGIPVVIGYGLTEAGTVLTVNDLLPFRGDTVGKPLRGTDLELRNKNEPGVGEVWVKGPTVMKGYLEDPELTDETIVGGWLRTGDLGTLDASGHLKLVGRAKNMIVTEGGKNVYPEDLESAFADLPGCAEQSVFAANYIWPTGKMTGEQLIIVVRPADTDAAGLLAAAIRDKNRTLVDYKRLSGYVVWKKDFPRTASMKVKRDLLAKEIAATSGRAEALKAL